MEQDASITRLKDTQTKPTGRFETGFAGQAAFRPEANARHALTAPRRRPRAAEKRRREEIQPVHSERRRRYPQDRQNQQIQRQKE